MKENNMTDIIEEYIKKLLSESEEDFIIIKRSNLAEKFDCVPSQLNYVIKTRFSKAHGFIIESKRGGGGFVRITKITLNDNYGYIDFLIEEIKQLNAKEIDYEKIIKILKTKKYINYFDYLIINNSLLTIKKNFIETVKELKNNEKEILFLEKIMINNIKEFFLNFLSNIKYAKEKK